MKPGISHDRDSESLQSKARWFQSLTSTERMEYLCQITDLIMQNNPNIVKSKNAQSPARGVRDLDINDATRDSTSLPQLIDEISTNAERRGMTAEQLNTILDES